MFSYLFAFLLPYLVLSQSQCPTYSIPASIPTFIDQFQLTTTSWANITSGFQVITAGVSKRLYSIDLQVQCDSPITATLYAGDMSQTTLNTSIATSLPTTPVSVDDISYTQLIFPTMPDITMGTVYTIAFSAADEILIGYANYNAYPQNSSMAGMDFRFETEYSGWEVAVITCMQPLTMGYFVPSFPSATSEYALYTLPPSNAVPVSLGVPYGTQIVSVNGNAYTPGSNIIANVSTNLTIVVASTSGRVQTTYDIMVANSVPSSIATLANVDIEAVDDSVPTLNYPFEQYRYNYFVGVSPCTARYMSNSFVCQISMSVTGFAGVTWNASINTAQTIYLNASNVGKNMTVTISVLAQDGVTTNTYNFVIQLLPGNRAVINNLTLVNGLLLQTWSPLTQLYTANFYSNETQMIFMMSGPPGVSYLVNGQPSGANATTPLGGVPCIYNTTNVTVVAEDGVTTFTYSISATQLLPTTTSGIPADSTFTSTLTLDIVYFDFPISFNSLVPQLINDISRDLGMPAGEMLILNTANTTTTLSPTIPVLEIELGFFSPQCGQPDYGKVWVDVLNQQLLLGAAGAFAATNITIQTLGWTAKKEQSVQVCMIGNQVTWGADCHELTTSSDVTTHAGKLTYEEAVGIVVAIFIILIIIVFLIDMVWRKEQKKKNRAGSDPAKSKSRDTELSQERGPGTSGSGRSQDREPQVDREPTENIEIA